MRFPRVPNVIFSALLLPLLLCACSGTGAAPSPSPIITSAPEPSPSAFAEPVWESRIYTLDYAGEDSSPETGTPSGVVVSLRFEVPQIKNTAKNPAWIAINRSLDAQGQEWLRKGREYWGTPGLVPEGHYSVESASDITRCDKFLSIRCQRTVRLTRAEPPVTLEAVSYRMDTGASLSLGDLFTLSPDAVSSRLMDELKPMGDYDRDYCSEYFNFNAFYLTSDDLVLFFPVYEEGETSPVSSLECPIPLSNLSDILIPELLTESTA